MRWLLAALLAVAPSIDSAVESVSAGRMEADVAFLSSKPLAGRMSGRNGGDVAAEFLAAGMRKAGLRPAAAGGSYFQSIPLTEFETDQEHSALRMEAAGPAEIEKTWRPAGNFSCRFPDSVRITAGVVFAGYGITAPELGYDDYAGIDARGKFVLVLAGEPQRTQADSVFNGRGDTIYAGSRVKTLNAQQHGAVGVLLVGCRVGSLVRSTSGGEVRASLPAQALVGGRITIPLVNVFAPIADDLLPDRRELERKIDAAPKPQSFELARVKRITLDHRVVRSQRVNSVNVAGWIEGSDRALRDETVILCAHHDHLGSVAEGYFPGANDNASGAAAVIELARTFAASGLHPRRSVLFIVFGSEEVGLLGSHYYIQDPLRPLDKTVGVVNLDMIGQNETPNPQTDGSWHVPADTSNAVNPIGTHYAPELRRMIEAVNQKVGLKLDFRLDADHSLDIFQRCDHYPFALERIPAIWLFAGFHPEYHRTTDTVDRLNMPKMLKIAKLAMRLAWELANQPGRPKFESKPGPLKETA
ncbi:MAG: M20/M25/M40 family metallo-hydrolase [Acidobacteria bacterium]|nr:M20/M25/M40 family metallo-hydrolase [Acidobacteriota bacterium]